MRLFLGTFLEPNYYSKLPFTEIDILYKNQLKPINRNYLHLTWHFLGPVNPEKVNKLEAIIQKNTNIFSNIIFKGNQLEIWPPGGASRIIVLSGTLLNLGSNNKLNFPIDFLTDELAEIHKSKNDRSFKPHITIARFQKNAPVDKGKSFPNVESFEWQIKEVSLIKSVLNDSGPTYTKISNWKL